MTTGVTTLGLSGVPVGRSFLIACADDLRAVPETNEGNNCRASATMVEVIAPDLVLAALTGPPVSGVIGSLIACADDLRSVAESVETNNCRAAQSPMRVTAPELLISALSEPPAAAAIGNSFDVNDTLSNTGDAVAGSSTTRYYLSLDAAYSSSDRRLTGTRTIVSLGAGESSAGTLPVVVPTTTAAGSYFLLACADDLKQVTESNEANNCRASAGKVGVGP